MAGTSGVRKKLMRKRSRDAGRSKLDERDALDVLGDAAAYLERRSSALRSNPFIYHDYWKRADDELAHRIIMDLLWLQVEWDSLEDEAKLNPGFLLM